MTAGEYVGTKQGDGPGGRDTKGRTYSYGMASHQISLQLREFTGLDGDARKVPEASVYSVNGLLLREDGNDRFVCTIDCHTGIF